MLCAICKGSGSLVAIMPNQITRIKNLKWFSCPGCNGACTVFCDASPTIKIKNKVGKNIAKLNRELDRQESLK